MIAALVAVGTMLPLALLRANRIVPGEALPIWQALPAFQAGILIVALLICVIASIWLRVPGLRLGGAIGGVAILLVLMGQAGGYLTPAGNDLARVSPAAGFWLLLFALSLTVTDALAKMKLRPIWRILGVLLAGVGLLLLLGSGQWDDLSVLREYQVRSAAFWREAERHLLLAFGSLSAAVLIGVPLGVACFRVPRLKSAVLNLLNIVQTVPSIAVFGLLIAPLAWIAATIPGAARIGVSGIGAAPAMVALFAYSLLPVVSNTVIGLENVPGRIRDAAFGMGMTRRQAFMAVEVPLAFPVILTGIRIVLVQNIGLATIAGLIGGGGFGVFVFQGMGQTATDLILLGALPTVILATASAVLLDAVVEISESSATRTMRA
ncbi:ABC transporter permease [Paracoccus sp. Z330]|uniref:ABC transporter permease n=1 Tax=Paracoccus onchidii TaxID=3017813 RepID=A0ABT4ZCA7_9RHOB|nr:ABC transporter permease [Paracoccus onchidii]MDB6176280.1 ABC transporter permease [Paracoccus onchidii]